MDWTGAMMTLGAVQVVAAVTAWKFLDTWPVAIVVSAVLLALVVAGERRGRVATSELATTPAP